MAPSAGAAAQSKSSVLADSAQKLIRNAELDVEVKDASKAVLRADSIVRTYRGFVSDNAVTQDDLGRHTAQLTMRVPSDRLDAILAELRQLGDVKGERSNTQDVTRDYADLSIRLKVKEETVARLRALLASRTAKLADVLQVEQELSRAITELEEMKGQQRYYDNQIALSTLQLRLFERAPTRAVQFTRPIVRAFRGAIDVLGTSVGALVYIVVFLLPWAAFAGLLWWAGRQLRIRLPFRKAKPRDNPPTA